MTRTWGSWRLFLGLLPFPWVSLLVTAWAVATASDLLATVAVSWAVRVRDHGQGSILWMLPLMTDRDPNPVNLKTFKTASSPRFCIVH